MSFWTIWRAQVCPGCGARCRCRLEGALLMSAGCCVHGEGVCEPTVAEVAIWIDPCRWPWMLELRLVRLA